MVLVRNSGAHPAAPEPPEVWTWDGASWSHLPATDAPAAWGSAAYEPIGDAVLFVGVNGSASTGAWAYDGSRWTQRATPVGLGIQQDDPPPMVSFGATGTPTVVARSREIWLWNGSGWARQDGSATLPDATGYAVASDTARHVILYFAGPSQTWAWDGQSWSHVA